MQKSTSTAELCAIGVLDQVSRQFLIVGIRRGVDGVLRITNVM